MRFRKPEIRVFDTTIFDEPSEYEKAYLFVSFERREKVDSLKLTKDKKLSLGAGYILKKTLLEFGVEDMFFEYSSDGKPRLKNRDDMFFNLSHNGKYAVLALYDSEVGIDVQKISKTSEKLIRRVSTDKEYDFLMSFSEERRNEEFARLWTIKESYLKFSGSGLTVSPQKLEVVTSGDLAIFKDGKKMPVSFVEYPLTGYKLTVCY